MKAASVMQNPYSKAGQSAQAETTLLPALSVYSWSAHRVFRSVLVTAAVWLLVAGCGSVPQRTADTSYGRTPIAQKTVRVASKAEAPAVKVYTVQKGDTLYGIALNHGLDYRELAGWNRITDPRTLVIGQQLVLAPANARQLQAESEAQTAGPVLYSVTDPRDPPVMPVTPGSETIRQVAGSDRLKTSPKAFKLPYSEQAVAQIKAASMAVPAIMAEPVKNEPVKNEAAKSEAGDVRDATEATSSADALDSETTGDATVWEWPATGNVQGGLSEGVKGIGIEGKMGQPVLAAATGKVVYSGSGLRGYGKLVIIKHSAVYLSAYAHNSKLLAREGQSVTRGQKIAEMGNTDSSLVKLHFEIRKYGKPVDPLTHLPKIPK